MVWDIERLKENSIEYESGKWGPAKPIAYPGDGIIGRLSAAWSVFIGSAAAVKWYK